MREELKHALPELEADETVKVVVLTGSGRAFCAGGDIRSMEGITSPSGRDRLKNLQKLSKLMFEFEKPIIAAVNGPATGAGFHLALACDIIIASEKAKFAESFVNIGLIPDFGGFYFLPLRIGIHKAKELMLTGRLFDATEANEMGLINKVVPHESLESETMTMARALVNGPGRAYTMIKHAMNHFPANLYTMLEIEANMQAICFETSDFKEGVSAFLEKRKPDFTGK
jgi:2-(1,2-epoxy-1,2-dihydrophenyl)acetyl-CoA isomerase